MLFLYLFLFVHLAASSEVAPSANSMSPSPNIDPPIVTYYGKSSPPPASDSAVLTLLSLRNLSVPVSWILAAEVDTHAYEGDRFAVKRRLYLGPQKSKFSNGVEAFSGFALFFPLASQHYNSSADPAKLPADTRIPKDCTTHLTHLVHAAAPVNITGFEEDATNTCNQLAGEIVINAPTSCFGYDVRNFHPQTLKGAGNVSNSTEGGHWHARVSPQYDLTLVETNTITGQRAFVAIKTMIDGSTPIITVLYPPRSSNLSIPSPEVYYTALKPANYQPLLTLTNTSSGMKSGVLIGSMALAYILL